MMLLLSIIKRKESRFDININKNFYSLFFNKKKLVKRSCGVIVVDGFIEKDQNLIHTLMGNDVGLRKDFIVSNAINVQNLDI